MKQENIRKYFLDIDKIKRFPLTFVIKSNEPEEILRKRIRENAKRLYSANKIVSRYMDCIEEIIISMNCCADLNRYLQMEN